jgi:hypothetical protein
VKSLAGRILSASPDKEEPRWLHLGRRYFPVALGAAGLAMIIGFFPSTLPASVNAPVLAAPSAAPALGAGGASASASPAQIPSVAPLAPQTGAVAFSAEPTLDLAPPPAVVPASSSTPAGGGPSARCPLTLPTTGTPADVVLSEIQSLCLTLEALLGAGSSGTPPLPSGVPTAAAQEGTVGASGRASSVPDAWVDADRRITQTDPQTNSAPTDVVVLGLVQGAAVAPALAGELAQLQQSGMAVELVLVPRLDEVTPASAFGTWVKQTVSALPAASSVAMAVGAVPAWATEAVAEAVAGGLSAARQVSTSMPVGLWWADGGTSSSDQSLWATLGSQLRRLAVTFVGAWEPASSNSATDISALSGAELRYFPAAVRPVVEVDIEM